MKKPRVTTASYVLACFQFLLISNPSGLNQKECLRIDWQAEQDSSFPTSQGAAAYHRRMEAVQPEPNVHKYTIKQEFQ